MMKSYVLLEDIFLRKKFSESTIERTLVWKIINSRVYEVLT